MRYITKVNEQEYLVEIVDERHASVNGVIYAVDFTPVSEGSVYSLIVDGKSYDAHVYLGEETWQVLLHGVLYSAYVEDEREKRLRASLGGGLAEHQEYHLKAPMPGLVIAVPVSEGQSIAKGDILLVLESMKMQNELKSPRSGVITRLRVQTGDRVEQKQTLLSVI
jgi:biotin carboxyl carrier protein